MRNTADILIDTLIAWEVEVIFGLPGDGINGIMEALRTRQDRIRFIQVRHEESAAFMATAYAKWTGKLGVCLATSGPGGAHLLAGLYDAKMDQAPVLAITGMQFHDLIETFTQQDIDLTQVFTDVATLNVQVSSPAHMESVAGLACRTALAERGVAHLSIASDVQELTTGDGERSRRNRPAHTPHEWFVGSRLPSRSSTGPGTSPSSPVAGHWARGTSSSGRPTCWRRRLPRHCWGRRRWPMTIRIPREVSASSAPPPRRKRSSNATRC
jgi:pyruvate dehydrogenase (quinone)